LEEAVRLAEELGDRSQYARSPSYLGSTEAQRGDTEGGASLLEKASAAFHALGDLVGERTCRNRLGRVLQRSGQFVAAAEVFRAVLGEAGPTDMIGAYSLASLGQTMAAMGEWQAAADTCQQAYDALLGWGYPRIACMARAEQGRCLHRLGRLPEAQDALEEALRIAVQINDRAAQASVLSELAAVAESRGETAKASQRQRQAATITAQLASSGSSG
jgi:tetratricopeptide (TPR) repeat protein